MKCLSYSSISAHIHTPTILSYASIECFITKSLNPPPQSRVPHVESKFKKIKNGLWGASFFPYIKCCNHIKEAYYNIFTRPFFSSFSVVFFSLSLSLCFVLSADTQFLIIFPRNIFCTTKCVLPNARNPNKFTFVFSQNHLTWKFAGQHCADQHPSAGRLAGTFLQCT